MNRFLAKVRLREEENAAYLIKAFFQNFNPESSLILKGNEVKMEVKVGDKVIFSKYAGNEIKADGENYIILRQSDILAIVEL